MVVVTNLKVLEYTSRGIPIIGWVQDIIGYANISIDGVVRGQAYNDGGVQVRYLLDGVPSGSHNVCVEGEISRWYIASASPNDSTSIFIGVIYDSFDSALAAWLKAGFSREGFRAFVYA